MLLSHAIRLIVVLVAGIVIGGLLVRWAPGFGFDENDLNPLLSESSKQTLHNQRVQDASLPAFLFRYASNFLRGELGTSTAFQRPVSAIIHERLAVTLPLLAAGALLGFL